MKVQNMSETQYKRKVRQHSKVPPVQGLWKGTRYPLSAATSQAHDMQLQQGPPRTSYCSQRFEDHGADRYDHRAVVSSDQKDLSRDLYSSDSGASSLSTASTSPPIEKPATWQGAVEHSYHCAIPPAPSILEMRPVCPLPPFVSSQLHPSPPRALRYSGRSWIIQCRALTSCFGASK